MSTGVLQFRLKDHYEVKKDLKDMTGISYATLHKLERGENMMTDVLNNICAKLNCDIGDIAEFVPDEPSPENGTGHAVE